MRPRCRDAGESLVEILISVMILGIAVSALLFGMATAATTSGLHTRQAQQAETVRTVIAALQGISVPYTDCATTYIVPAAVIPAGYTATASVSGYAPKEVPNATADADSRFVGTCPTPDQGAQQVEVVVKQLDERVLEEDVVIVKRKSCRTLPC